MKRLLLTVAAASAVLVSMPMTASAAPWQSINQRQANLDQRIDQGVRSGQLNRAEAARVRGQFHDLTQLERQYRRSGGGLNMRERQDLDQKFDRLSQRVYAQKHDRQDRPRRY
jgi:Ni/Co efflux regulator RcnB